MSSFEASANALKISYLRFVSDSAPGLVVMVGLVLLHGQKLDRIIPQDTPTRGFVALAGVLLATPLGLLINGVSYFAFGGVQRWIDRLCFVTDAWMIREARRSLLVDEWRWYFAIKKDDWPRMVHEVDELLDSYAPHLVGLRDPIRGLKRFSRSIALLGFIGLARVATCWSVVATEAPRCNWSLALTLLSLTYGFLVLSGLLEFYEHGATMLYIYQLVRDDEPASNFSAAKIRERLRAPVNPMETPGS